MKDEKLNNNNMYNSNICEQIELLIDDYLDGMISAEDKNRMDAHTAECAHCSNYLEETIRLLEKVNAVSKDPVPLSSEKKNRIWNAIETGIANNKPGSNGESGNVLKMNPDRK